MSKDLLQVCDLAVELRDHGTVLSDICFDIHAGEIVGIFGESGCGKTTLALAILNLLPEHRYVVRGSIRLRGRELVGLGERAMQPIRGGVISLISQDPMLALNPVMRVRDQVAEILRAHRAGGEAASLLELAGLPPSQRVLNAYPHQLSGGERQRVTIAQALACRPSLVIADEPFTALDAIRVVELAALFRQLKEKTGSSFIVISHSPGVLARIADSVLVMRDGRIVEQGQPCAVFGSPKHPYTAAVLAAAERMAERA
jgi:ABC-type glutathione transport system ATPase component